MLLAGDVGGTKTLLGLFEAASPRPRPVATREFATLEYPDLAAIVARFTSDAIVKDAAIGAACFGVAGPIVGDRAQLTNVPWAVDARQIASLFGFGRVSLLNDLQAMAYGVTVLEPAELHVLQPGRPGANGNRALIAAGTGLGQALLHWVNGAFVPSPTEAGHADFAARTEREIRLLQALTARFGRVDVERVVSGHGLVNIHAAVGAGACAAGIDLKDPDAPPAISASAMAGRCPACVETLSLFVEAYGAEAGNLALRSVATGGVFVGGGIAPKILPALEEGSFLRAFRAKAPLEPLLAAIPVSVILNPQAGLLGAAVYAAGA